jgi:hypothetical protein
MGITGARNCWHKEPELADLIDDELVGMVMRRDGVERSDLMDLIARQQKTLREERRAASCE